MEMIEQKAKGEKVVLRPEADSGPRKTGDLMAALEASLQKAKGQAAGSNGPNGGTHRGHPRRRKSA